MNRQKNKQLFRFAVDLFIQLVCQVTKRKTLNYKCNDADLRSWDIFVEEYGDAIGEDFLRRFIEYGIQSWFNDGTEKDYGRSIRFNWVIGATSIKRWNALQAHVRTRVVRTSLKKEHKIDTLQHRSHLTELFLKVRSSEEKAKKEFHNTKRGLLWCVANTTLYFHKSELCVTCEFKNDCKETLRLNYPKLYTARGYGK